MLIRHKSDPDNMPPSELRSNTRTQSAINTYMFSHKAEIRQCNSVPEILFVCLFYFYILHHIFIMAQAHVLCRTVTMQQLWFCRAVILIECNMMSLSDLLGVHVNV